MPAPPNSGEFPWGTKGNLNRIGDKLRADPESITSDEAAALGIWRASHYHVLNAFNVNLRDRAKGLPITVARRHKRRVTIIDKLAREPGMHLSRMDDVAGIRLIFQDVPSLLIFRKSLLRSNHKHTKKNRDDKYDYITNPKQTGYRGIHDVYSYYSEIHNDCNGTMIEVQYRTQHHHAWSTANEVFTMLNPYQRTKFGHADADYMEFFRLTSEIFARAFDGLNSVYPDMTSADLLSNLNKIDNKIWMETKLKNINVAKQHIKNATAILRFMSNGSLEIRPVPSFKKAMDYYFDLEREFPNDDIVLVNSRDASGIRSAYRNYFSDTTDFLSYLDQAKKELASLF